MFGDTAEKMYGVLGYYRYFMKLFQFVLRLINNDSSQNSHV